MDSLISQLTQIFRSVLIQAFPQLESEEIEMDIAQSKQEKFGHYQCNIAMRLAKPLKLNPRQIAQSITNQVDCGSVIEKLEIAGPGFINITLTSSHIEDKVLAMALSSHLDISPPDHPQRIIVEFSSPNPSGLFD